MESFRQQRSPAANTFLGLFSQPPPPGGATATSSTAAAGDELEEDDIFWTETGSPEPYLPSSMPTQNPNPNPNPNPSPSLYRNLGILAALPEEDQKHPLLQRNTTSSARIIPVIPKPKADYAISAQKGRIFHQSAPVNVPIVQMKNRRNWDEIDVDLRGSDDAEEEMLPPHEIVARAASKDSPLTTFSMLEGVGRTLKGRDLRKVRNAVWRQTGFLD